MLGEMIDDVLDHHPGYEQQELGGSQRGRLDQGLPPGAGPHARQARASPFMRGECWGWSWTSCFGRRPGERQPRCYAQGIKGDALISLVWRAVASRSMRSRTRHSPLGIKGGLLRRGVRSAPVVALDPGVLANSSVARSRDDRGRGVGHPAYEAKAWRKPARTPGSTGGEGAVLGLVLDLMLQSDRERDHRQAK